MLLKDPSKHNELKKNGYVVIPFLTPREVEQINSFYNELHAQGLPDIIDGIHMTTWCRDTNYKNKVADFLNNLFLEPTNRHFDNIRRLNHVFIVKKSGKETTFKVHQDWNVIDETRFESVNVWVPLHDVDEKSGALWVLKGSHNIKRKIRGAGYLFPDYSSHFDILEKHSTSVKLNAGEAIVFYHSIIHGSPPNLGNIDRRAACFTVIPKNAPLCIYFQPAENDPLMEFEPSDDFMYQYNYLRTDSLQIPPASEPKNEFPPYKNKKVELKEIRQIIKNKKGLFSLFLRVKN